MVLGKDKRVNFIIVIAISLLTIFYSLQKLSLLSTYFSVAFILAYFFDPLYEFLLKKKVPKVLAILIIFSIIIALLIVIIFLVIPSLINQLTILYNEVPNIFEEYQSIILSLRPQLSNFINPANVEILIKENFSEMQKNILGFSQNIIIYLSGALSSITFGMVIIPLILFYLLRDILLFKENLYNFVSKKNKGEFKEIVERIDRIISGFIRGRLVICTIVGFLIGLGLYLLNLKFALIIGIISGVLNIIPYLGPIFGLFLALIFALGQPWWTLLLILILFIFANQVEAIYLNPAILGKELGLHPLTVIFSMLVCGQILGILGVLIAVPLVAILKVLFVKYLIQEG